MLLKFDADGIYCEQAGVYIDPWKPVDKAIITHAHSDHARWGSKAYLCHTHTLPFLKLRLGEDINVESKEYNEPFVMNGVTISLHPAGHILGSAQVRLEYGGEVWVVSGDYKLQHDDTCTPYESVRCNHFVTESTFGLPIYNFPAPTEVHEDINIWWQKNASEGKNSVITGYALGKAQRVLQQLNPDIGKIYLHGAVDNIRNIMSRYITLPPAERMTPEINKKDIQGAIIVAPPSAIDSPWMRKFDPYSLGICSGWMQLRGARRRRNADRGFILSDHCDWQQLNTAIKATGAEHVYVTHGYQSVYAKWLRDEYGLDAREVKTMYEGENMEGDKEETTVE